MLWRPGGSNGFRPLFVRWGDRIIDRIIAVRGDEARILVESSGFAFCRLSIVDRLEVGEFGIEDRNWSMTACVQEDRKMLSLAQ